MPTSQIVDRGKRSEPRTPALATVAFPRFSAGVSIRPLVEYHFELVTAEPDPAFRGDTPLNRDEHWLVFGLRTDLTRAFAFDLGTEIALRSVGFPHGPPLAPYRLIAGAAFILR
jgi:hypothetical protein